MFTKIEQILAPVKVNDLTTHLQQLTWEDGVKTGHKSMKKSEQITYSTKAARPIINQLADLLLRDPKVYAFAQPKMMSRMMFSRYSEGMFYKSHNDAPITGGGGQGQGRADVSFTVFLNPPDNYSGGELVLESPMGEMQFKEAAGDAVFYDTGLTHRVEKVTDSSRLVIVGWMESWVQDPQARAIIRDLDDALRLARNRELGSEESVRLSRIKGNLIRRWAR